MRLNALQSLRSKAGSEDLVSRLMRGAMLALIVNVVGFSAGFLAHLVVGRTLGPESYGHYALTQAWVSFIAMVCGLGLPSALLRFIPVYQEEKAWPLIRAVTRFAEHRVLAVSLALSLIGLALLTIFGATLAAERLWTLYAGLIAIPLLAFLRVRCAVLRAFGRIVSALGSDLPVREGVTFVIIAIFGLGFPLITTAPGAMLVWAMGGAAGVGISLLIWHSEKRPPSWHAPFMPLASVRSHWLQVALLMLVIQSLNMLLRRLDLFVVDLFFDGDITGIYAAANRIVEVMIFPSYVLNAYLAPTISALYSQQATASLQKATVLTARMGLASAVILLLPFLFLPDLILGFFGPGFREGATVLRILAAGEFLATALPFATMMLTMTGHERVAVRLMATASAITLLAMLTAGAMGSVETIAIVRATSIILIQIAFCWLIQKKIKISPWPFSRSQDG